jgi:hypothetical protein
MCDYRDVRTRYSTHAGWRYTTVIRAAVLRLGTNIVVVVVEKASKSPCVRVLVSDVRMLLVSDV